jgi:hypothetical protein
VDDRELGRIQHHRHARDICPPRPQQHKSAG